ncbi:hypothetical protein FRB95_010907 [Tulasnella sp. JGI-2019a]|nr:hypothetical protein FRB95_010907 [Tulasnella sp. JGI-2019a]
MSSTDIPNTHRAVTAVIEPRGYKVITKPLPIPADNEILVKVRASSLNPTDWKSVYVFNRAKDGNSVGSDFAGDVVHVGKDAARKGVKLGDAVAGFVLAHRDPANSGFQEYLKVRPESVLVFPKDKISYQQAAPFGVALSTAVQALYHRLELPTPWAPGKEAFPILIWAGSTAVGIYAIKLAKLSGLLVATTASPRNHEFLKQLGADAVFDYKDPEAPRLIREWSHDKITVALDTVSEQGSTQLAAQALGNKGGKIITLLPVESTGRADVEAQMTLVPTGIDPTVPEDFAKLSDWYRKAPPYLSEFNVVPIKVWENGLDGAPDALEYMKAGKVSAQKIVLNIA